MCEIFNLFQNILSVSFSGLVWGENGHGHFFK